MRRSAVMGTLCLLLAAPAPLGAGEASPGPLAALLADGGTSSREARDRAVSALPLERMPAAQRRVVEKTLRTTTLFRRLPLETISCDAELLAFALDHPETIVDIWRLLGISHLSLDPAGPSQWRLADGYGTVGVLRLVHRERRDGGGLLVFHGRGGYAGTLAPKPLSGTCLIVVQHRPTTADGTGRARQAVQVDSFLDVDGMGLEIVTRTLQPLIVRSAAANLHEICLFMESLSAAATRNPAGIERLAGRLARTEPADRQALAAIARGCASAKPRSGDDGDDPQTFQAELASRWLPAESPGGRMPPR